MRLADGALHLGAEPDVVARARHHVANALAKTEHAELVPDAELVVSELVTNAVRYGRPPVTLELEATADGVTAAVADGTPERPDRRNPDLDDESGRGLLLIDLLAADSGVRPVPPGKAVWAALPRP